MINPGRHRLVLLKGLTIGQSRFKIIDCILTLQAMARLDSFHDSMYQQPIMAGNYSSIYIEKISIHLRFTCYSEQYDH